MARNNGNSTKARINRTTGVSSNVNGARGVYVVSANRGNSQKFGDRKAKYRDIRRSFGLSAG